MAKRLIYSKHNQNIGKIVEITKANHDNLEIGTVGKIVNTYTGGYLGLMRSDKPAVVLEIQRLGKSPIKRIVSDTYVSDEPISVLTAVA